MMCTYIRPGTVTRPRPTPRATGGAARSSGVSHTDILLAVAAAVAALGCLLAFIFLALQGWRSESSFDAILQSLIVPRARQGADSSASSSLCW